MLQLEEDTTLWQVGSVYSLHFYPALARSLDSAYLFIEYDLSDLNGLPQDLAVVHRWDETTQRWQSLATMLDTVNYLASAMIPHGGSYAVFIPGVIASGNTIIEPNPQYWFFIHAITPMVGTIFLGDFEGRTVGEINHSTISINGTIIPDSFVILPSHPSFSGEALACYFNLTDFILQYGLLWDITVHTYTVSGQFVDDVPFLIDGEVTMIGHVSGDVNADGAVNVADLTHLVDYLFKGGTEPPETENADVDHNGIINIADVTALVDLLF